MQPTEATLFRASLLWQIMAAPRPPCECATRFADRTNEIRMRPKLRGRFAWPAGGTGAPGRPHVQAVDRDAMCSQVFGAQTLDFLSLIGKLPISDRQSAESTNEWA